MLKSVKSTTRVEDTITVDLADQQLVEEDGGCWVRVTEMEVVFVNQSFKQMTITGKDLDDPDSTMSWLYQKVGELPGWAIPWTVYLGWEIHS